MIGIYRLRVWCNSRIDDVDYYRDDDDDHNDNHDDDEWIKWAADDDDDDEDDDYFYGDYDLTKTTMGWLETGWWDIYTDKRLNQSVKP
jgi:hypothetical protein